MKHSKEEIIGALKLIKDECQEQICPKCTFYNPSATNPTTCMIRANAPMAWNLNDTEPETWRAFK